MAIQHLFAFSSSVDGAAIAAGSPYGCGAQAFYSLRCYLGHLDVLASIRYARRRHVQHLIDDPVNLRETPVVLFSGKRDWTVWPTVMKSTQQQLAAFLQRDPLVFFNTSASHVWSVDHGDCGCGACPLNLNESNPCCNVNNCGFDLSGTMLRSFYGDGLLPRVPALSTGLRWVDQWQFMPPDAFPQGNESTLLQWALVYVPSGCRGDKVNGCRVHVNYHGCSANSWTERLLWVTSIDINTYAEANSIVAVYPQSAGSTDLGEGCWNWASYEDDPLFDTRRGVQLQTVANLVNHLQQALATAPAAVAPIDVQAQPRVGRVV